MLLELCFLYSPILPLSFIPALTQTHTFPLFTHLLNRTTRIGGLKTAAKPMLTDANGWFLKSPNVEIVLLLNTDRSLLWIAGLETSYQSSPDSWTFLTSGPLLVDGVWAGSWKNYDHFVFSGGPQGKEHWNCDALQSRNLFAFLGFVWILSPPTEVSVTNWLPYLTKYLFLSHLIILENICRVEKTMPFLSI